MEKRAWLSTNTVHRGDARMLLCDIEPESIACSVWSPPYHLGKDYEKNVSYEEWVQMLQQVIINHTRILKSGAFLVVNIADILCFPDPLMPRIQAMNLKRQTSSVTREDVLAAKEIHPNYNRYQLATLLGCSEQTVDRRLNHNNIRGGKSNIQTRVKLVGEIIEKAGSDAGLFLYDRRIWKKDPAWENSKWHTLSYRAVDEFEYLYFFWKPGITVIDRSRLTAQEWTEWGSRAVWSIPSVRANDDHEAKFPVELPRRIIKLLTAPGDTILDCFFGSGSTGVAAIQEGRNYIGIEMIPKYVKLARDRCAEEARKMEFLTTEPIVKPDTSKQLSLLDNDL